MKRAPSAAAALLVVLVCVLSALPWSRPAAAAQGAAPATISLRDPLAYVASDGNVYLADLSARQTVPLTEDSQRRRMPVAPFTETTRQYGQFRWSPDGAYLLFVDQTTGGVFVAGGGKLPLQVATTNSDRGYPAAWSPDGREIAYVVGAGGAPDGVGLQVQAVPVDGGPPRFAGAFTESGPCPHPTSNDPAAALYWHETGFDGAPPVFEWTKRGFLRHSGCDNVLMLTESDGREVWRAENVRRVAIAPNGERAAAVVSDPASGGLMLALVELSSGAVRPIQSQPGIDQIAWMPDGQTLVFSAREAYAAEPGALRSAVGLELFPGAWPLQYENKLVRLLTLPATGGAPVQRFVHEGMAVTSISPAPDGSGVAFSLVTSSAALVQRVNLGAAASEVLAVAPETQMWYAPSITGTDAVHIVPGGPLAFGRGVFTAQPARPGVGTLDPATEVVVGRPALVMVPPGDGLNLRTEPGFNAPVIRELNSAEVVDVIAGPQSADGARWWQLRTFEQRTGWAIDRIGWEGGVLVSLRPLSSDISISFYPDIALLRVGECVTVTWRVERATSVFLNSRAVPPEGSETSCPSATSPFYLFALGPDGAWAKGFVVGVRRTTGG
ncbi:MAG: PD40 domain-containing protein [Anaerolineae bacterium]|nr:PD40 domain-containing protein [Anaerolineae bacterium]